MFSFLLPGASNNVWLNDEFQHQDVFLWSKVCSLCLTPDTHRHTQTHTDTHRLQPSWVSELLSLSVGYGSLRDAAASCEHGTNARERERERERERISTCVEGQLISRLCTAFLFKVILIRQKRSGHMTRKSGFRSSNNNYTGNNTAISVGASAAWY